MSLSFDSTFYQAQRPDVFNAFVATQGSTGLTWAQFAENHFNTFGWVEGSDPNSRFDTSFYLNANTDVAAAGVNPFTHFLNFGSLENRQPFEGFPNQGNGFDPAAYAAANSDLAAAGITTDAQLYQHFVVFGQFESRPGAPTVNDPGEVGQTFTLTTGADAGAAFTGTAANDTFVGTNTTLTPGDDLDGGAGTDILKVSTNIAANTTLAGFATKNIETVEVTADGAAGSTLTFDVTGVNGATSLNNVNSSLNTTLQGMTSIVGIGMSNVSNGNTVIVYDAPTVAGTSDAQSLSLQNVNSLANTAVSSVTANGIEIFNVDVTGTEASLLTALAGGGAETTLNVTGSQGLTIAGPLGGALNTIDASTFTGPLDVTVAIGQNLSVVTGSGDDIFRTQAGDTFNNKDSVDLGAGTDTLFVDDAVASAGAAGATFSNVEQLGVNDGIDGAVDMDNWSGINKIISTGPTGGAGISSNTTINNIQDGFALDLGGTLGGFNLTLDHKTDTTTNTASLNVNLDAASQALGTVTLADAETFSITATDATNNAVVDTLTIGNLIGPDLNGSTLNLAGDANITIAAATAANLSKVEGGTATGALNINSLGGANTALTINTGSGNDLITGSTKADTVNAGAGNDTMTGTTGADSYTGGDGTDTYNYASGSAAATAALSNNANGTDTITDFVSGTDALNLNGLTLSGGTFTNTVIGGTTTFVGNQSTFALAQGALRGGGNNDVVYQADQKILWVDTDANGTLDDNDFRLFLTGTDSITGADVGINTTGVTFTANTGAAFSTAVAANSVEGTVTAAGADTINATTAEINASGVGLVNGNAGTDILNVTTDGAGVAIDGTVVNVETVNLQQGSTADALFTNPGTIANIANTHSTNGSFININFAGNSAVNVTGGAGNDQVTLADDSFTGTFNGGGGLNTLVTAAGTNIAGANGGAALTNFQALNFGATGTNTMTTAQHNALVITGTGGADTIVLSGAGDVNGVASIENYTLSSTANTFTVNAGQLGVNLTESAADDQTVNIGGNAVTGDYIGFDGGATGDILVATTGADISGAQGNGGGAGTALGFGVLNLTGTITMTAAQEAGITTFTAGGGADRINLTTAAAIGTAATSIETYDFQFAGVNSGTLSTATQNFIETGNGTLTVTLNGATVADYNGTVNFNDTTVDVLNISGTTDIAGATFTNLDDAGDTFALIGGTGASVTMTDAQHDLFQGTVGITAAGNDTITISNAATITADAAIENYVLSTNADTILLGQNGTNVTGGNGIDRFTVNDAGATADVIQDFTMGAGGDIIQISEALTAVAGVNTLNAAIGSTAAVAVQLGNDANDVNVAVVTDLGYANATAAHNAIDGSTAIAEADGTVLVFFNTSTNRAEVYYDDDLAAGNGAGIELLATLDNITTLGQLATVVGTNFEVVA